MGQVMTKLTLWNNTDLDNADRGIIPREAVRKIELDALVDTGATMLMIPQETVDALGLPIFDHLPVRLADRSVRHMPVAGSLKISILNRGMLCDALVGPTGCTALIGQIPLERLDLIVDPKAQEVRVNPASPDSPLLDLLSAA
jgi:clan AA aspartic protease